MTPRPIPVPTPTGATQQQFERDRLAAREVWATHLRDKELRERLELHRRLAYGESRDEQ